MATNPYAQPLTGTTRVIETADGALLHTVWNGDGPRTVLLAHGFGSEANAWSMLAPLLLEQGFRVIAFDQRGHGQSTIGRDGVSSATMALDYGAVLEVYDARDVILVGHSMGGFLALAFLLEQHEALASRVGALLLMATFAGDVTNKAPQNKAQIPLIKSGVLQKMLQVGPVRHAFTKSLVGDHYDKGMADAFVPAFLRANHEQLIPILEAMCEENRYGELHRLDLPCTVVVGTEDKTTPPFHSVNLHKGISGSRTVTLIGAGHALNWEAPEKIARLISELAVVHQPSSN